MATEAKHLTAIYPGTFDPITLGHMDIVRRGLKLVDKLVIGVTTNPDKKPLFSAGERLSQIIRETSGLAAASGTVIEVVTFDTLLMDFAVASNADIIIRGLRAVSDFEYEFQMAGMNSAINSDIETVFLMADARLQSIASRLVKEIAAFGGDITPFVPSAVAAEVMKKQKT